MTASTAVDSDTVPGPGEITICGECADVLMFGEGLRLERVPINFLDEFSEIDREKIKIVQNFVRTTKYSR